MKGLFPDITTTRGIQNRAYAIRAISLLDRPEFRWLHPGEEAINKRQGRGFSFSIMTELGRIANDNDLLAVALEVCRLKPSAGEAVAMIRRWRTGKVEEAEADAGDLAKALIRCINDYLKKHPSATWKTVQDAMMAAKWALNDSASK